MKASLQSDLCLHIFIVHFVHACSCINKSFQCQTSYAGWMCLCFSPYYSPQYENTGAHRRTQRRPAFMQIFFGGGKWIGFWRELPGNTLNLNPSCSTLTHNLIGCLADYYLSICWRGWWPSLAHCYMIFMLRKIWSIMLVYLCHCFHYLCVLSWKRVCRCVKEYEYTMCDWPVIQWHNLPQAAQHFWDS